MPADPRTFADAALRWNLDHPEDWPGSHGDCPACGWRKCFGRLPSSHAPEKWCCFNTDHDVSGVGRRSRDDTCFFGDALDLEAHRCGLSRADVLKRDGYLEAGNWTAEDERRATAARRKAKSERARREKALAAEAAARWDALAWPEPGATVPAAWVLDGTRFIPTADADTAHTNHGVPHRWSRDSLVEFVSSPPPVPEAGDDWIPGISAATFRRMVEADRERWTGRFCERCSGRHRSALTVLDAGALIIDLDSNADEPVGDPKRGEPELAPEKLKRLLHALLPGMAWVAHTTRSSVPGGWRWRVIVPLRRRVTPGEYREIAGALRWAAAKVARSAALRADTGWDQAWRFYYAPAEKRDYRFLHQQGALLDPDLLHGQESGDREGPTAAATCTRCGGAGVRSAEVPCTGCGGAGDAFCACGGAGFVVVEVACDCAT